MLDKFAIFVSIMKKYPIMLLNIFVHHFTFKACNCDIFWGYTFVN